MAIQKRFSLRQAAKQIGISRATLKAFLTLSGMEYRRTGGKCLLCESDIERITSAKAAWVNPIELRQLHVPSNLKNLI
jgi:phage antirepressor YoqD-like protein